MKIIPSSRSRASGREEFDKAAEIVRTLASRLSPKNAPVEVNLVGERAMTELNKAYRNRSAAAEILTFPYGNDSGAETEYESSFGEIYLCGRSLARGAHRRRVSITSYMVRLIVHGLLHLEGHCHNSAEAERKMEARERKHLRELLPAGEVERLFA